MKGSVCSVCGYVVLDGVTPENCPVCHSPKTAFKEKEEAFIRAQDPKSLTELEKKHIPVIVVVKKCGLIPDGCMDVHAKTGEIVHPMLPEHFMMSFDFYLDKKYLSRIMFTPGSLNPAAGLHLKVKSGRITVISHCNIHGNYIQEAAI